ncbi:MAG TPA: type VI secretion system-associated protein TagF [Luteimonas sp.]|nr:type VI secretion system-associated protein TagF [Luteimonas sp.]
MSEVAIPVGYFGKLPSRGDFVRTADNHQLMQLLDRWAGQGLELLSQDVAWKQSYEAAPPLHFAFLGSGSRLVIAGHLQPSRDASERRFPFLSATQLQVPPSIEFVARSPLAFSRLWTALARMSRSAVAADDAGEPLRQIADTRYSLNVSPAAYDASFADFLDLQVLDTLEDSLADAGHGQVVLKWALPALGLLLQPALTGASMPADKGLSLPLPRDPLYRPLVAAFWLDLVSGFLARADVELALLLSEGERPRLMIGFNGADGRILHSALDARVGAERLIDIQAADWVEDQLHGDYALNKLASYLDRGDLSLRAARQVFRETFLGA